MCDDGEGADEDLLRLGLEFYEREQEALLRLARKLTRRVGPQREQLVEDAMHEAMRTVPMAMSTYDGAKGASLRTHVLGCARWYMWKVITRAASGGGAEPGDSASGGSAELSDGALFARAAAAARDADAAAEAREEVQSILGRIPDAQARVLRWRFVEALGLDEIAELLGCSTSSAHRYVSEAIQAARGAR